MIAVELADLHRDLELQAGRLIGRGDRGAEDHAMIHVYLRILSGRADEQKTKLGEAVLAAAVAATDKPPHLMLQITVEIGELDRDHYHKRAL